MKATLEFNLPEDDAEHVRAINAQAAWGALSEIREMIRAHMVAVRRKTCFSKFSMSSLRLKAT